jgi:glycosyltransferase involved in cell wall biosynthesis
MVMLDEVRRRAEEFDVLHFHIDYLHYPLFRAMPGRTVTTAHGRQDMPDLPVVYSAFPEYPLISISDDQRRRQPSANWLRTIYHGLPADLHSVGSPQGSGYLAFLGRICPEKRPDRAIEIAKRSGIPLKIAAKVDRVDQAYFEDVIRPLLDDPRIEFIGEIGEHEKPAFLGGALALLFPIDWPEPFGLVLIEAMACGTPVIAWRCGSVPEVIQDGLTGFVVGDMEGAVEAVSKLDRFDRAAIRGRFEQRFTAARMAQDYVAVYSSLMTTLDLSLARSAARLTEGRGAVLGDLEAAQVA